VCHVERNGFAAAALVARMADTSLAAAPVWDDLRSFDGRPWRGRVHLVSAGYPCQPFSLAGNRLGADDPRHLWPDVARIVREVSPEWCFFENVPGHLSLGFDHVAGELQGMGYRVAACVVSAVEVGAPAATGSGTAHDTRILGLGVARGYEASGAHDAGYGAPSRRKVFDFIGGQGNLGNVQAQLEFVWQELLSGENGVLKRLQAAPNLYGATQAFVGYERPQGWSAANPAGAMHWDQRLAAAEAAMSRFEGTTDSAQAQLGQLGTGAAQLGTGLQTFGANLAGTLQGIGASYGPDGAFVGGLLGAGLNWLTGVPGFATGGDHAGGWRIVGENGPELEATGAARIFNAGQTRQILTSAPPPATSQPSGQGGASGGNAAAMLVTHHINVSGTGSAEIREGVMQAIQVSLEQYTRDFLPGEVRTIVSDRWRG